MDIFTAISKRKVDYSHVVIFILTKKKLQKLMGLRATSRELMEALQHEAVDYIGSCSLREFESNMYNDDYSQQLKQYCSPHYITVVTYRGYPHWTYLVVDVMLTMLLFSGISRETRETVASAMLKIGLGEKICEEL